MNDIINTSEFLHFILYAHDTNIFISDSDKNMPQNNADTELKRVSTWFQANKLFLNIYKTKYMFFRFNHYYPSQFNFSITLDNDPIEIVHNMIVLGIENR